MRLIFALLIVLAAAGVGLAMAKLESHGTPQPTASTETDTDMPKPAPPGFAECLAKKGYAVYGATWCHWCKTQKLWLFGNENTERPPYVNCQTVYGASLHAECKGKPLEGFPTWLGPDGQPTDPNGAMTPQSLSDLSGCPLK